MLALISIRFSMFNNSKYYKLYSTIISIAQTRNLEKQYELHHIIPGSCGGDKSKNNTVKLTLREHFICHLLLTKSCVDYQHTAKMIRAYFFMCRMGKFNVEKTSRKYEMAKLRYRDAIVGVPRTEEVRHKISISLKALQSNGWAGKTHSIETKIKMSISAASRKRPACSEETKAKISAANLGKKRTPEQIIKNSGRIFSEEHKEKIRSALKGKTLSEETKTKIKEKLNGRIFSEEHKAKIRATKLAKKRQHGGDLN